MCGIVAYVGSKEAGPILLEGLRRLEYRGYDSAGISVLGSDNALSTVKKDGKLKKLETELLGKMPRGSCGIAHTRWATHGAPTTLNAHPHSNVDGDISLVHNGIVENSEVLRRRLIEAGYRFCSDTDTEAVVHLIDEAYRESDTLEAAVLSALRQVEGTFGIAVISSRDPNKLVVARNGSPLVIGIGESGENLAGSDVSSVIQHTKDVVYLDDGDCAVLTPDGYKILHLEQGEVQRSVHQVEWGLSAVEKGGYEHFMLKEIFEQPATLGDVMRGRLLEKTGDARLGGLKLHEAELAGIRRIVITACGTSWHAALLGEYMIEEISGIPVEVEYASEFRYRSLVIEKDTLIVAMSQSGETADTLAALKEGRSWGTPSMGIVNVVGSSIARETDFGIYLHAGPEIGVASTKAFTSQIVALALFALYLGRRRKLSVLQGKEFVEALKRLPEQVSETLLLEPMLKELAEQYGTANNFLYLGRGYQFPVALEGALKLKEVSYIHAEGYPAAEMKHGPIALIDENMPVVALAPRDPVYGKVVSNIEEVKARNGKIIAVVSDDAPELKGKVDHLIQVPQTIPALLPVLTSIPLQLLAYHAAIHRDCDVDQPRNLAKSVTVE